MSEPKRLIRVSGQCQRRRGPDLLSDTGGAFIHHHSLDGIGRMRLNK
jgi:hypothetical protein